MDKISVSEALKVKKKSIIIDVRAPKEFLEASIPGAINLPIFDDMERSEVGTAYKQIGKEEAVELGVKLVSPKLEAMTKTIMSYAKEYDKVIIYCWRGGMRSESICKLMQTLIKGSVYQLDGGFKAYRKFVMDYNENNISSKKFIVLHGLTGVGKTRILVGLDELKYPILDLEGLANNAGSVFGNILYPKKQPTQKDFEALLFETVYFADTDYFYVESESKRIGAVSIPETYMAEMSKGIHILISTTTVDIRMDNLILDYKENIDDESIIKCLNHLRKQLSNDTVDNLIEMLNDGKLDQLVKILLVDYYDPLYKYSIEKYEPYDYKVEYAKIQGAVDEIAGLYETIIAN